MKKLHIFFIIIFLSTNVTTETKQLTFLYTNDLHAHLQPPHEPRGSEKVVRTDQLGASGSVEDAVQVGQSHHAPHALQARLVREEICYLAGQLLVIDAPCCVLRHWAHHADGLQYRIHVTGGTGGA